MAGVCRTCGFFVADVHPGEQKPHHCAFQDVPLSEEEAGMECEEHVPGGHMKETEV